MNTSSKSYLKNVRSAFPVFQRNEKRFFNDFTQNVTEYEALHSDCTTEHLVIHFGNPKEVVTDYFNNMDSERYLTLMKRSFYLKIITLMALALLFLFFILQTVSLYHLRNEARKSIPTHTETTIIYEND